MIDSKQYSYGSISFVVQGESRLKGAFNIAPKIMTNEMAHFMAREGKNFIGNKTHQGSFRRSLRNKTKRDGTGKKWGPGIPYAFTRNVSGYDNIDNMTLKMGINDKKLPKMPFIPFLATGGTVFPKNSSWMMIPVIKNLKSVGLFGRIGTSAVAKNNWTKWRKNNQHILGQGFVFHGKYLIFGDSPDKGGSHKARHTHMLNRKLLFVGVKRASIKKRFDFERSFISRSKNMQARGEKFVDRAIQKMSTGKMWAA